MSIFTEKDPQGLTAKTPGAKMDAGKSPVSQGALLYFPRALLAIADVSLKGAEKYSWKGWEHVDDGFNRYTNAMGRHFLKESIELIDADTQCTHAACVAWNALARLEIMLREQESSPQQAH